MPDDGTGDHVVIPLEAVGLYWLSLLRVLNVAPPPFTALIGVGWLLLDERSVPPTAVHLAFRPSALPPLQFAPATILTRGIKEAFRNIEKKRVRNVTYPASADLQLFESESVPVRATAKPIVLSLKVLTRLEQSPIPAQLWQKLGRHARWLGPSPVRQPHLAGIPLERPHYWYIERASEGTTRIVGTGLITAILRTLNWDGRTYVCDYPNPKIPTLA